MTEGWTSRNGITIRDLVPADLRRQWVRSGECPGRDLYALFREHVRAHPDRAAVIDGASVLDYAELDRQVRRIAAALTAAGLGGRDIVGIRMPNGWRMVVAELAVAAIGAVALPYPSGPGVRDTISLLSRSRASAGIFGAEQDADIARALPDIGVAFTFGTGRRDRYELDAAPSVPGWSPAEGIDPESPARILVTSGSQTEPKMIAYSHNAMAGGRANYVRALREGTDPMRALILMPMASSYGSCATFVSLAALGSTLVLMDRFDPVGALHAVTRHRPTHLFGVPTMLRRLSEQPESDGEDVRSLRAVVSSSAPLSDVTARACSARFGVRVITVYGSSDGVNCHTARSAGEGAGTGTPDPSVASIRLVDSAGRDVPRGAAGEIWARGPMTPLCYVADPELDSRCRTPEGWVRSGDRGVFDDAGRLHVLGRIEQVVSRGGYTISPAEVEREISAHPGVVDVACVPVPDDELGERMCACVSQADGSAELTLGDVADFLERVRGLERRKLPELLLRLPELPLAPTGKVCRRTVTAMAVEHHQQSEQDSTTARHSRKPVSP